MGELVTLADSYWSIWVAPSSYHAFAGIPWDVEVVRTRIVSQDVAKGYATIAYTVRNNLPEPVTFWRYAIHAFPQPLGPGP
jgi:hypothetical protein